MFLQELASAAENSGNTKVAVGALRRYLKLYPNVPQKKQIEAQIKALSQSSPTVSSGNGG